jgi:TonB-dependent starch-binding outer membrane protein SusC
MKKKRLILKATIAGFLSTVVFFEGFSKPFEDSPNAVRNENDRPGRFIFISITITGTVFDENGTPAESVNISERGTQNGTSTDKNGEFILNVSGTSSILEFTSVAFETLSMPVNSRTNFTVKLRRKISSAEEVVVIGYGSSKKKNLVSAVDIVSAKDAGQTAATDPAQLLVGKSAGVQIIDVSGLPRSGTQIIIRGTGSFTDASPLYVIDGIQGDFNSLSPQDIENITILKDASSTAIYGSAAANGVVIVTTKRAKSGAPKITYATKFGLSKAWKQLDLLNTNEYVDLIKDIAATKNVPVPDKFNSGVLKDSTNWQKQVFRSALMTENYVNLSGGSDKVLYNLSVGYMSQGAIIRNYHTDALTVRIGLDETIGRFRFGQNLNIKYTRFKGGLASIINAIGYAPYKPVYDQRIPGGYSIVSNVEDNSDVDNPLQTLGVRTQNSNDYVLFPQIFGEVNLLSGLKFRSQIAMTIGGGASESFQIPFMASNYLSYSRQAEAGFYKYATYTFENYFSFDKSFKQHNISATLGNSYIDAGNSSSLSAIGSNINNNTIPNIAVALTQTVTGAGKGYATQFGNLISYFARLSYAYADKYLFSASVRRDGSSNFGANNRFGNFPGGGVGWKFTEEDFVKKYLPFVSQGKLRAGWGRTGNNKINLFLTDVSTYSGNPSGNLVYSFGSTENFYPGTSINSLSNPNLRWEQTDQTDLGLDLAFLNNRLSLTLDWYDRRSSGLLVNVPLPTSNGIGGVGFVGSSIITNAADAENRGFEISLGYRSISAKEFSYNLSINAAFNKNNVRSLGSQFQAPIQDGSFSELNSITYTAKGFPIGSFYGYNVDHVAKDQAEIDALNSKSPGGVYQDGLLPGDFIFKDLDGDKSVTDKDQKILGNPMPKISYGMNGSIAYKQFDLNVVINGLSGLKLVNATKFYTANASTGHNTTTKILQRWVKPGDNAALPRAAQSTTASGNLRPSDFFVENGAFLRVRNITVGYTVPKNILNRISSGRVFASARIYVAAQNLLTFTKYSGYDPEISTQGGGGGDAFIFRRGIDDGQLPQPRIFIGGIQFGF